MNKIFIQLQIFVLLLALHSQAKVIDDVETLTRFDRKSWSFLTKFASAEGVGNWKAKAKFYKAIYDSKGSLTLNVLGYTENEWNKVMDTEDCRTKESMAKFKMPFEVPTNGDWSNYVTGDLKQDKTLVWYFVLSDCDRQVTPYAIGNRIHWEVEAYNSDGSHFSQDENGMILPLLLVMGIIVGFFFSNSVKFHKFYNTEEGMDYPTLITTIALFLEFCSVLSEILHLWIYSYDGRGSMVFNFFNHVLSISSQFVIACLLLLIAYGWSINFMEFEDMDIFIPLGILLGVLHIIVVGVGKITDDEHYRYHDYENWAGIVIIVLRLVLFIFWVFLLAESFKTAKGAERRFFNKFGVFGAIYFLAFPLLVVYSSVSVTPSSRHKVVTTGTLFIQTATLLSLSYIFTTKKSQYAMVSLKGKALLPTSKLA